MLSNGLSASERSWDSRNSALCDWEQAVNYSLTGNKRHIRRKLLLVGSATSHRPFLEHFKFMLALFSLQNAYSIVNVKFALFYGLYPAAYAVWYHYLVEYYVCLRDSSDNVTALYFIALLDGRGEVPEALSFQ